MGLFVELMCDLRLEGRAPGNCLIARCWSDRNDNPQGGTPGQARAEGRRQGWKVGPGNKAVCPGCRSAR